MASVATWSTTPASNTSVGGISTDGNVTLVNQIDNMFRGQMAEVATSRDDGTIINVYPRGYLSGLTLSNNAGDATNDIDIAVGECVTLDSPYWRMALASSITKRLDATWAVGTGNGGLDTGSIANTTYHVWLIQRSDTLVVDALFSTSATAPTMPTNYDRKRRIGSIIRLGATILAFTQTGDTFDLTTSTLNYSLTSGATNILQAFTVPNGISVQAMVYSNITVGVGSCTLHVGSGARATANMIIGQCGSSSAAADGSSITSGLWTTTSGQLRVNSSVTGTVNVVQIWTSGWVDTRGR